MERRGEPFRLVATMDHYTPLHLRTHVSWPVPMLLYDSRSRATDGLAYTEANAARAVLLQYFSIELKTFLKTNKDASSATRV